MTNSLSDLPNEIRLSEALDLYHKHLGLPEDVADRLKNSISIQEPGIIFLSDQPLEVQLLDSQLVVDREAFIRVLEKIKPKRLI
ncbi:MAG: hypothetical protein AB1489_39870 [Acidobacteriota bacterium]